jgi:hypothetical protein
MDGVRIRLKLLSYGGLFCEYNYRLYPTAYRSTLYDVGRTYARPYGAGWFWQVRDLLIRGGAPGNDAGSRSERA